MKPIAEMHPVELDELEQQIHYRRLAIMAQAIEARGLHAKSVIVIAGEPQQFEDVLVYAPGGSAHSNAWANLAECQRLLDTLANLAPAQAYERWYAKVADPSKSGRNGYTRQDAIRDTIAARAALERRLDAGEIDSRQYAELYSSTSFMDLAK
jgi:hypothetical protein